MAARKIELPHLWKPRVYQDPLWRYMHGGGKRAIAIWPRRHGKDDLALHFTACAAHERVGVYWHLLPQQNQARKAIWDAVNPHTGRRRIDDAFPRELRENTRENDMLIRFKTGSTWQVIGSDNYDALVGTPRLGAERRVHNVSKLLGRRSGNACFGYSSHPDHANPHRGHNGD